VLFRNALARCSTPTSAILFQERSSVVSVCVKKSRCEYEIDEERMRVTVLFRDASARCSTPTSAILFEERFSVVSVCVKKRKYEYEIGEERIGSPCCFVMH
jgi:hypothetical protein